MTEILAQIPPDLIKFLLVVIFSLLIGLEQRRHNLGEAPERLFGTDRTFTLIGIAGYIFYVISPHNLMPFIVGAVIVGLLLAVYYFHKISMQKLFGMTSLMTALITYCLAPLIYTQPKALVLLIVVAVLVVTEIKEDLRKLSSRFGSDEFISLAKFLVLAGVILPILPDEPISESIKISPYKFWLAIGVVSGMSYASYLLRKFIFPDTGILLTGILGGLYSSTATTVILARKSHEAVDGNRIISAMFLSLTMMYLRIFMLALFFHPEIAMVLLPRYSMLTAISALIAAYFMRRKGGGETQNEKLDTTTHQNPLEFRTALVFGLLFVIFALVTQFAIQTYGGKGVSALAFVVGVTDIDPFIISLFQGKWDIPITVMSSAVLIAILSNNVLKLGYALFLSEKSLRRNLLAGFGILIIAGAAAAFI